MTGPVSVKLTKPLCNKRGVAQTGMAITLAVLFSLAAGLAPIHGLQAQQSASQAGAVLGNETGDGSYFHDQVDIVGCPHPVAIRLPRQFLPIAKSQTLQDFINQQITSTQISGVYQSQTFVHQQWRIPSTVSVGIIREHQNSQGSYSHNDFLILNARTAENLSQRSDKVQNYLDYVAKTQTDEQFQAANYLFGNTFYLNDNHFLYYDVSTVTVGNIYQVQKLNAANFLYVNGCIVYVSVEVIDNLITFAQFHELNGQLEAGLPQTNTPRYDTFDG